MLKKVDLHIFVVVIILSGTLFYLMTITSHKNVTNVAIIREGQIVARLDLSKNTEVEINNVVIEILDGRARVKSSSCPDKICVKSGWIRKVNEQIVCLPNKMIIKIQGN